MNQTEIEDNDTPQASTGGMITAGLCLAGLVGMVAMLQDSAKQEKEQKSIREFYHNLRVDTVRNADGTINGEKTTVHMNLNASEHVRKKIQPE